MTTRRVPLYVSAIAVLFIRAVPAASLSEPPQTAKIFKTAVAYSSGGGMADSLALGDLNGDGNSDLVVANYCIAGSKCVIGTTGTAGSIGVLLGNGDGTFRAAVNYPSGGNEATAVALADVNGDHKLDLIVANLCDISANNCANGSVTVLLGNGDGSFQTAVSYISGGISAQSVAVGDVNGDGKPDLLVANKYAGIVGSGIGSVAVLLGNGDGTFKNPAAYLSGSDSANSVAIADINQDGKSDLLVANNCPNSICSVGPVGVLLGDGNGTFQTAANYFSGCLLDAAFSVSVGDLNSDSKPDLVVTCADAVSVLFGNGDGTFQAAANYVSGGTGMGSVAIADVNGDNKPDLLVANNGGSIGTVGVLVGNGDGTFQPGVPYPSAGYKTNSVVVADVNGDGMPDVLTANLCARTSCANGSVSVLLGLPAKTATLVTTSGSPSVLGQSVTFTASVTSSYGPIRDGDTVAFYDGTAIIGTTATANGFATFSTSSLTTKIHTIKATYQANGFFKTSSGTVKQVVKR